MSALSRRALVSGGMVLGLGAGAIVVGQSPSPGRKSSSTWTTLPPLPRALGGQMVGVHGDALLVAGGSDFQRPPWEGGGKRWVDSVYVLTDPRGSWRSFRLPDAVAYAGCVSTPEGVLLIGGSNANEHRREVLRLTWNGSEVEILSLPPLSSPVANAGAGFLGGRAYVVGGQQSPGTAQASAELFSLGLHDTDGWRREPPLPAAGRILPAVAVAAAHLYVCSGAQLLGAPDGKAMRRYLRDAWRFSPATGWEALAPLPRPTVAAASWGSEDRVLIFGGDDGNLAQQPDLRERHPGFSREVLAFDPGRAKWETVSRMPRGLVTTGATLWHGRIVIAGGEDRPAHRSSEVLAWG